MIIAIGVMFVTSLLLVATFTAANGEIHLSATDTSQKKAYYAALAGIENYENHLTEDGNYLTYCTNPPATNAALNQVGETTHRAKITNESGESLNEEYAIQLLPAESAPANDRKCDPNNLVETMLEEKSPGAVGTFRIESTGYSGSARRTLVADFRNANFVSFVWYTKYETGDPAIYGEPLKEKEPANYYTECSKFYGERPADGGTPAALHQQLLHQRRICQRANAHRGSRRRMRVARLRPQRKRSHRIRARIWQTRRRRLLRRGRLRGSKTRLQGQARAAQGSRVDRAAAGR